jgi:DNA-binding transcriptional regulator YiaG
MTFKTVIIQSQLPYIKLKVKQSESPFGVIINHNPKAMEEFVIKTLIQNNYEISGQEVLFIRKYFGLNLKQFSEIFGVTSAAIIKWQKKIDPLEKTNQIAIRAFVVEKFGLQKVKLLEFKPRPKDPVILDMIKLEQSLKKAS